MSVLAIRHALSSANIHGSASYGDPEARLVSKGIEQGETIGTTLVDSYGIDPSLTPVAVSNSKRTDETAETAGFVDRIPYEVLGEVENWKDIPDLMDLIRAGQLPPQAIEKAKLVLSQPPKEPIWITHSLVIAGLCTLLEVHQDKHIFPNFGEIRELPIGQPISR
jgi:hypothetical protein